MSPARSALVVVALTLTGCVKQYVPPGAGEPHAVLKYRRRYEKPVGTMLVEVLRVDKHRAYRESIPSARASVPRTDALLVRPGQSHLEMFATFSHQTTQMVQVSYSCGTSTCYRTENRQVTVVDGSCKRELDVSFAEGEAYLVELDYQNARHCTVHCIEQRPTGDGKFASQACR